MSAWWTAVKRTQVDVDGEWFGIPVAGEARILSGDAQTVYVYRDGKRVDEVPARLGEHAFVITLPGKVRAVNTTVRVRMHSDDAPATPRAVPLPDTCCGGTRPRKGCA